MNLALIFLILTISLTTIMSDLVQQVRSSLNALEEYLATNDPQGLSVIADMRKSLNTLSEPKAAKKKAKKSKRSTLEKPPMVILPDEPTAEDFDEQIKVTKEGIAHWQKLIDGGELRSADVKFARSQSDRLSKWLAKVTERANGPNRTDEVTPWADICDTE